MRRLTLMLPTLTAALALGATGSAQAGASLAPRPQPDAVVGALYDTTGTAGWYTNSFADTYTRVDGTFTITAQDFATGSSIGIQLCNASSGDAIQLGALHGAAGWQIGYFSGVLSATTGLAGDPCNGNVFLQATSFTPLIPVPAGATVQAQISELGNGSLDLTVADSRFANFTYQVPSPPGDFNEAGASVSDPAQLSWPAINVLTDFTGVTATDSYRVTGGLATWNAVQVNSSADGIPPALITTTAISPATGPVCTWHPGHRMYWGKKRHRHYRWVKGYRSCTGGGPSSFSVLAGTPVGAVTRRPVHKQS